MDVGMSGNGSTEIRQAFQEGLDRVGGGQCTLATMEYDAEQHCYRLDFAFVRNGDVRAATEYERRGQDARAVARALGEEAGKA